MTLANSNLCIFVRWLEWSCSFANASRLLSSQVSSKEPFCNYSDLLSCKWFWFCPRFRCRVDFQHQQTQFTSSDLQVVRPPGKPTITTGIPDHSFSTMHFNRYSWSWFFLLLFRRLFTTGIPGIFELFNFFLTSPNCCFWFVLLRITVEHSEYWLFPRRH